jgi:hypothetical protein
MHFHGSIHGSDSRTYMSEPVGWVREGQFSTIGHPNNNWHPHGTPPASPQANAAAGVYHFGESVEPVPYVAAAGHVTQQAFPPPPPQQAVLPPTPAYGGAAVTNGAVANGAVANGAVANEVPPLPPLPPPAQGGAADTHQAETAVTNHAVTGGVPTGTAPPPAVHGGGVGATNGVADMQHHAETNHVRTGTDPLATALQPDISTFLEFSSFVEMGVAIMKSAPTQQDTEVTSELLRTLFHRLVTKQPFELRNQIYPEENNNNDRFLRYFAAFTHAVTDRAHNAGMPRQALDEQHNNINAATIAEQVARTVVGVLRREINHNVSATHPDNLPDHDNPVQHNQYGVLPAAVGTPAVVRTSAPPVQNNNAANTASSSRPASVPVQAMIINVQHQDEASMNSSVTQPSVLQDRAPQTGWWSQQGNHGGFQRTVASVAGASGDISQQGSHHHGFLRTGTYSIPVEVLTEVRTDSSLNAALNYFIATRQCSYCADNQIPTMWRFRKRPPNHYEVRCGNHGMVKVHLKQSKDPPYHFGIYGVTTAGFPDPIVKNLIRTNKEVTEQNCSLSTQGQSYLKELLSNEILPRFHYPTNSDYQAVFCDLLVHIHIAAIQGSTHAKEILHGSGGFIRQDLDIYGSNPIWKLIGESISRYQEEHNDRLHGDSDIPNLEPVPGTNGYIKQYVENHCIWSHFPQDMVPQVSEYESFLSFMHCFHFDDESQTLTIPVVDTLIPSSELPERDREHLHSLICWVTPRKVFSLIQFILNDWISQTTFLYGDGKMKLYRLSNHACIIVVGTIAPYHVSGVGATRRFVPLIHVLSSGETALAYRAAVVCLGKIVSRFLPGQSLSVNYFCSDLTKTVSKGIPQVHPHSILLADSKHVSKLPAQSKTWGSIIKEPKNKRRLQNELYSIAVHSLSKVHFQNTFKFFIQQWRGRGEGNIVDFICQKTQLNPDSPRFRPWYHSAPSRPFFHASTQSVECYQGALAGCPKSGRIPILSKSKGWTYFVKQGIPKTNEMDSKIHSNINFSNPSVTFSKWDHLSPVILTLVALLSDSDDVMTVFDTLGKMTHIVNNTSNIGSRLSMDNVRTHFSDVGVLDTDSPPDGVPSLSHYFKRTNHCVVRKISDDMDYHGPQLILVHKLGLPLYCSCSEYSERLVCTGSVYVANKLRLLNVPLRVQMENFYQGRGSARSPARRNTPSGRVAVNETAFRNLLDMLGVPHNYGDPDSKLRFISTQMGSTVTECLRKRAVSVDPSLGNQRMIKVLALLMNTGLGRQLEQDRVATNDAFQPQRLNQLFLEQGEHSLRVGTAYLSRLSLLEVTQGNDPRKMNPYPPGVDDVDESVCQTYFLPISTGPARAGGCHLLPLVYACTFIVYPSSHGHLLDQGSIQNLSDQDVKHFCDSWMTLQGNSPATNPEEVVESHYWSSSDMQPINPPIWITQPVAGHNPESIREAAMELLSGIVHLLSASSAQVTSEEDGVAKYHVSSVYIRIGSQKYLGIASYHIQDDDPPYDESDDDSNMSSGYQVKTDVQEFHVLDPVPCAFWNGSQGLEHRCTRTVITGKDALMRFLVRHWDRSYPSTQQRVLNDPLHTRSIAFRLYTAESDHPCFGLSSDDDVGRNCGLSMSDVVNYNYANFQSQTNDVQGGPGDNGAGRQTGNGGSGGGGSGRGSGGGGGGSGRGSGGGGGGRGSGGGGGPGDNGAGGQTGNGGSGGGGSGRGSGGGGGGSGRGSGGGGSGRGSGGGGGRNGGGNGGGGRGGGGRRGNGGGTGGAGGGNGRGGGGGTGRGHGHGRGSDGSGQGRGRNTQRRRMGRGAAPRNDHGNSEEPGSDVAVAPANSGFSTSHDNDSNSDGSPSSRTHLGVPNTVSHDQVVPLPGNGGMIFNSQNRLEYLPPYRVQLHRQSHSVANSTSDADQATGQPRTVAEVPIPPSAVAELNSQVQNSRVQIGQSQSVGAVDDGGTMSDDSSAMHEPGYPTAVHARVAPTAATVTLPTREVARTNVEIPTAGTPSQGESGQSQPVSEIPVNPQGRTITQSQLPPTRGEVAEWHRHNVEVAETAEIDAPEGQLGNSSSENNRQSVRTHRPNNAYLFRRAANRASGTGEPNFASSRRAANRASSTREVNFASSRRAANRASSTREHNFASSRRAANRASSTREANFASSRRAANRASSTREAN